jgi:hypothetical protein
MTIPESKLQRAVIELAQTLGWKVMHPLPAQTKKGWATAMQGDGKGFPDLTLVRERIMFVELKSSGRYLTADQRAWRDRIVGAGGEWYCWKPLQWQNGTVEDILKVELPGILPIVEIREVTDPERFGRLLKACSGDVTQARRIYSVLAAKENGPTAVGPLSVVPSPTEGNAGLTVAATQPD